MNTFDVPNISKEESKGKELAVSRGFLVRKSFSKGSSSKSMEISQSAPLLLCSLKSRLHKQQEEADNMHNMLVDSVEVALGEDGGSPKDYDHSMSGSEWSKHNEDMNEEMEDDLTLEQAQEELRKEALVHKGC